jgi:hypothetical protein
VLDLKRGRFEERFEERFSSFQWRKVSKRPIWKRVCFFQGFGGERFSRLLSREK